MEEDRIFIETEKVKRLMIFGKYYALEMKLAIKNISLLSYILIFSFNPFWGQENNDQKKANVIIIITDDQGYGDLSCHGNPTLKTPNIDKIYSESVRFTNFHVSPTCSPTRAALMTGLYSNKAGVWHTIAGRSLLREDKKTIADYFNENNYNTAIFGKWHLGDNYPFRPQDRGFKHVLIHGAGGIGQTPDYFDNDYFDDHYLQNGKFEKYDGYCTDIWFDEAIKFIQKQKNRPFFCYISTNAPHGPLFVDDRYSQPYEQENVFSKEFYGMISNIDYNVGNLTKKLEEFGIADNTILIFMTDNGSSFGDTKYGSDFKHFNAGMRGKKNSEYDGGHRVPFFIRYPDGKFVPGTDINKISAHIDVLPTLIDICNLNINEENNFDGKSLLPLIKYPEKKWRERMLITDSQRIEHPIKWRKSVVMSDSWRLVNGSELYQIIDDPGQTKNLESKFPERVVMMRNVYDSWWENVSIDFHKYAAFKIGTSNENPINLTSHDWHSEAQVPWNHRHIRAGIQTNGFWVLDIESDGNYEITLSRWPLYLNLPITSGIPKRPSIKGTSVIESRVGKALPINEALISIGDAKMRKLIDDNQTKVSFTLKLKASKNNRLSTSFIGDGINMGAYYVQIKKL